jgi:dTDP-4-dehydrorhamnose 3,5-epimerase
VDIRKSSPTYGQWVSDILSAENKKELWIPEGFAHGFYVLSDAAEVFYKATDYWAPEHERYMAWNDSAIGIKWPLDGAPTLSDKDQHALQLSMTETFS